MRFDEVKSAFVLSSGREIRANDARLSVRDGVLAHGYDDLVTDPYGEPYSLTSEERREIAEAMIAQWNAWA